MALFPVDAYLWEPGTQYCRGLPCLAGHCPYSWHHSTPQSQHSLRFKARTPSTSEAPSRGKSDLRYIICSILQAYLDLLFPLNPLKIIFEQEELQNVAVEQYKGFIIRKIHVGNLFPVHLLPRCRKIGINGVLIISLHYHFDIYATDICP